MHSAITYQNRFLCSNSLVVQLLIVLAGNLALIAVSQINIPWQPVPLTFQSAIVVLLGLMLGARRATLAVSLYLFEGAIGLPVFAGFATGLPVLFGPTAGYLLGFLPAAFVAGWLMERGMAKSFLMSFAAALISATILFACGILHLQIFLGFQNALNAGLKPFLLTEPVKLAIAAFLAMRCWK